MAGNPFHKKRRTFEQVNLLAMHLEKVTKQDNHTFWEVFGAHAAAGKFENLEPFKGLVMASLTKPPDWIGGPKGPDAKHPPIPNGRLMT
jgi:hypothetical protein